MNDAARRIETKRAEQEQPRQRAAERARQLRDPFDHDPHRYDPPRRADTRSMSMGGMT